MGVPIPMHLDILRTTSIFSALDTFDHFEIYRVPRNAGDFIIVAGDGPVDFITGDELARNSVLGEEFAKLGADLDEFGPGNFIASSKTLRPILDAYWRNILGKVNAITEIPDWRWDWRTFFDSDRTAKDKIYSRWGGFVEPIARELPMEYALELNRLIELQMEGAVG